MIYLHIVQLIKYNFEFSTLTLTQTLTQKSTKKPCYTYIYRYTKRFGDFLCVNFLHVNIVPSI